MYVVTGGAGFIGSAVVEKLNREGVDEILIVDRSYASENEAIDYAEFRSSRP